MPGHLSRGCRYGQEQDHWGRSDGHDILLLTALFLLGT